MYYLKALTQQLQKQMDINFTYILLLAENTSNLSVNFTGARQTQKPSIFSSEGPTSSSGPVGPWGHSFYTSFSHLSSMLQLRDRRSTLTRVNPGHTLPQVCPNTLSFTTVLCCV